MISALSCYRLGGLGLAVLGLPLMLRVVPQNPVYGARFPQSFASSTSWYSINAYLGKLLTAFGVGLFALSFPLSHLLANATRGARALLLVVPSLALVGLARRVKGFASTFDQR